MLKTLTFVALVQTANPLSVVVDPVRPNHDMLHYDIAIAIPDTGGRVLGATTLQYVVREGTGPVVLNFDSVFTVDSVISSTGAARYEWIGGDMLSVHHWGRVGDTLRVQIFYQGSPKDGLFIQDNIHGSRTAFADNWPNRAHHWFPSEDHPSDKATASFQIEVPDGWNAVANGRLEWIDSLPGTTGRTVWHWRTEHAIPVYTMVIGAGPLTITTIGHPGYPPTTLWTFPEDSAFAVEAPFRRAAQMLEVYTRLIGPFPYEKLAHVESSTRFGGMENSSAIFYTERGYADRRMREGLVAHETAHQWFGDAVTEYDWHHLWLSEGFASYFDPVFFEMVGEHDHFREDMQSKKQAYMNSQVVDRPVIDTSVSDYFQLLNANNYPKGAWILHMLRGDVGDSAFFRGVREYYRTFRDSTALTSDLVAVMNRVSGKSLQDFFEQWLLQPGYPRLDVVWSYDQSASEVSVVVTQRQPESWGRYQLAVPVLVRLEDGRELRGNAELVKERAIVSVRITGVSSPPRDVVVDPENDLLVSASVSRAR